VRESLRVLDEEKLLINLQKNKQMKGIDVFHLSLAGVKKYYFFLQKYD